MASLNIQRDDKVQVISGTDKGQAGPRSARAAGNQPRAGRARAHGEEECPAESAEKHQGRHCRAGSGIAHFERDAGLPELRSHACGSQDRRRYQGARLQEVRTDTGRQEAITELASRNGIRALPNPGPWREERRRWLEKQDCVIKYNEEIRPALKKELGLSNTMAVPRIEKIVLNMGLGEATQNVKIMDPLVADLATIAGQKPVTTRAKKSIAAVQGA